MKDREISCFGLPCKPLINHEDIEHSIRKYRKEICTFPWSVHFFAFYVLCIRWTPCSSVITSGRMFDFDYFCSVVHRLLSNLYYICAPTSEEVVILGSIRIPKVSEDLRAIGLLTCISIDGATFLTALKNPTPASTRVISSTRIPANGNFPASVAAVANRRGRQALLGLMIAIHLAALKPLDRGSGEDMVNSLNETIDRVEGQNLSLKNMPRYIKARSFMSRGTYCGN